MSKICKNVSCENVVLNHYVDENGKSHNCQRRKYCFVCSPFGLHNTRQLESVPAGVSEKKCIECGKEHSQKGRRCFGCYFRRKKGIRKQKIIGIVGKQCWLCNYDRTWNNLCFHHVTPEQKKFGLSAREVVGTKWERVFAEMQKCVLVCMNCHGEIHAGLIPENDVKKLHKQRWKT